MSGRSIGRVARAGAVVGLALAVAACEASETEVLAGGGASGAGGAGVSGASGAPGGAGGPGAGGGGGASAGGASGAGAGGNAGGQSAGGASSAGAAGTGGAGASAGGANAGGASGAGAASCKRGSAYGFKAEDDLAAVAPGAGWWYNWSPRPDPEVAGSKAGLEFVPMIWGEGDLAPERVAMIPAGARYLLGFNEPNFKSQSNLSAKQAAALWPQVEKIAEERGLTLVSPALNFCGPASDCWATDPFVWLDEFFASCPGCRVDHVAVHWYACTKDALSWYLGQVKEKYQRPVWLTEFSCLDDGALKGDPAKQASYMGDALGLLDQDPMVFRYAWFSGRWKDTPAVDLLGSSGQLTALGQQYVSSPGGCSP